MKRFVELVSRLSDFKTRMGGEKEIEEVIQLVLLEIGKMSERTKEIRNKLCQ